MATATASVVVPTGSNVAVAGSSLASCSDPRTPPSGPSNLTTVGGTLYFTADDGVHGGALWKSDGTAAGTVLVKDFNPHDAGDEYYVGPTDLTGVGGTLFFTADDGVHGRELWKTNGTAAGTALVKDIGRDAGYSDYSAPGPTSLTAVGGTLFFTADDGVHGEGLWKTNGTSTGTVRLKDLGPQDDGDYYGDAGPSLAASGGELFFAAGDDPHGRELWKTDGTTAGTVLVKDIHPDGYDSNPAQLTDVDGTLFFAARDGVHGSELWTSDGTQAGTVMVKDVHPGGYDGDLKYLTATDTKLFFAADDGNHGPELWTSDGTQAGTAMVKEIDPVDDSEYGGPSELAGAGGTLFFTIDDGSHGEELWTSDGSAGGTALVKDIRSGDYGSYPASITGIGDAGGRVLFTARDGRHGPELWTSNGSAGGTALVKDIGAGVRGEPPSSLTGMGGKVYFAANDGTRGAELWKSDGTEAGTFLVKDINLGGKFTVAAKGAANTRNGTMRVRVAVEGAGRLAVAPVAGSRLKSSAQDLPSAGTTTVTLSPTAAGMRTLKRVGKLKVQARFTFTPCGGVASSVVRSYTLRLR